MKKQITWATLQKIEEAFQETYPKYCLKNRFKYDIRRSFGEMKRKELIDAMYLATSRVRNDADGCLKYFCGICWNIIRDKEEER